jgi:hypothetical protein
MKAVQWTRDKIQTWWYVFSNTVFNPAYYPHLKTSSFSFSLKFLSVFFALYMVLWSIILSVVLALWIPKARTELPKLQNRIVSAYPVGKTFSIKDGQLSTNSTTPILIKGDNIQTAENVSYSYFAVIDPAAKESDYVKSDALVLVTNKSIVVPGQSGLKDSYEVYPISSMIKEDVELNRSSFASMVASVATFLAQNAWTIYAWLILVVTGGLLVFGTLGVLLFHLVYFLLLAGYVYAISAISSVRMSYKQSYRFTMHAFVTPFLIDALLKRALMEAYNPLYFLLIFTFWCLFLLHKKQPQPRA